MVVQYRHNDDIFQWAAIIESGFIDLLVNDEALLIAGDKAGVRDIVERAVQFVGERRGIDFERQPDAGSGQANAELEGSLREQAETAKVPYGSLEHFKLASETGGDDGGPLLQSAWVYELPNQQGLSAPINSGCVTLAPGLDKNICSVLLKGGLLLFEKTGCRLRPGQIPLLITSAQATARELGVWCRLASSAYTWG
jgi:hypothetical protein